VSGVFQAQNVDIKKFFDDLGVKAMTSGIFNARPRRRRTISDLKARLDVQRCAIYEVNTGPKWSQPLSSSVRRPRRIGCHPGGQAAAGPDSAAELTQACLWTFRKLPVRRKVPDDTADHGKGPGSAHLAEFCPAICFRNLSNLMAISG